jgi:hypothetical protein
MSFQTPITIAKAVGEIQSTNYVLPAIQREFVRQTSIMGLASSISSMRNCSSDIGKFNRQVFVHMAPFQDFRLVSEVIGHIHKSKIGL